MSAFNELTVEDRALLRASRSERKAEKRAIKAERTTKQKITTMKRDGNPYLLYVQQWSEEPTILRNAVSQTTIERTGIGEWKFTTELQQVNTYHVDWFWRRHRELIGSDLALEFFPNSKEISESVAAYRQLVSNNYAIGDIVLVVGDGTRPRTGSIFASDSSHPQVYSVDPLMYLQYNKPGEKLMGFQATIEDWLLEEGVRLTNCQHLTLVAVHSHAVLHEYLPTLQALLPPNCKLTIVAIPCCMPQEVPADSKLVLRREVVDWGILSQKRTVKVWTSY